MQQFEQIITVSEDDLDELNHVNNVRYVKWVNTIAKAHWQQKTSKPILERYFWVLISHCIDYKKPAILGDAILIKTYVTKSEGVTSTRIVDIYNSKTNVLLATSKTNWCFMNFQTQKPTRIPEEIKMLFL